MLNVISNSSAFVLKRSRLLYGRDKDSLAKVDMFVQSHAQTFLLSSTIFYHITCFKCDLCRVCSKFLKSVEWIRYNVPILEIHKINMYHSDIFRHYVHHNARNFNSSFSKSYLVHGDHFMINWQLKCTSDVSNHTTNVFFAWLYLIKTSFVNVCIHRIHILKTTFHIIFLFSLVITMYTGNI